MVQQQRLPSRHGVLGSIPSTESKTNKMQPTRSIFQILLGDAESISREHAQDVHCSSTTGKQDVTRQAKPTCWSMKLHAGAGVGEVICRLVNGMSVSKTTQMHTKPHAHPEKGLEELYDKKT